MNIGGPSYGGFVYEFLGKEAPFIILASLVLIIAILQLMMIPAVTFKEEKKSVSVTTLVKDPYILIVAGALTFSNMPMGMLESSLPSWMINKMKSKNWELGIVFLPESFSYLIGTIVFGKLSKNIGRWLSCMIGMILIGVSLICVN